MSDVTVRVKQIKIPDNLLGKNYEEDIEFRESLKQWTEDIWLDKDNYIEELKK
jgi:hypothetical protein